MGTGKTKLLEKFLNYMKIKQGLFVSSRITFSNSVSAVFKFKNYRNVNTPTYNIDKDLFVVQFESLHKVES